MDTPYFSVLLPTKNRAGLLPYAIGSLRDQSFRDFEVVVADNDDTTATAEMFYGGLGAVIDPRFRYLRTGGLWMSENWEAALAQARGQYVYVMEDKAVLHPRALELLAEALAFTNARCLAFNQAEHAAPAWLALPEAAAVAWQRHPALPDGRPPYRQISSSRVIDGFLEEGWRWLHDEGPRGINSVVERELIQQIQQTSGGGRFYLPMAPDVTSGLLQLDLLESIARIDLDLVSFAAHAHLSAGWKFRMSLRGGFEMLIAAGADNIRQFQRMPLGYLAVLHNSLYAEFLHVRERARGRLRGRKLSVARYFDQVEQDLRDLETFGENVAALQALVHATRAATKVEVL
jgi:glycosyltransferase involved in cell wall biosynthesis